VFVSQPTGWRRHLVYRTQCLRWTWKLRALLLLPVVLLVLTRALWTTAIGSSLVCEEALNQTDALVIDNLDPDYLVFERAVALYRTGVAPRIFVPVVARRDSPNPNVVSQGIAELMARVAHMPTMELVPIIEREPISLNVAHQMVEVLSRENVTAVTVLAPAFRSARSRLVYATVLLPAGISVRCSPVFGSRTPRTWTNTFHGIQEVSLQFVKLQYYRLWVLS
jgi:hypothetical protein